MKLRAPMPWKTAAWLALFGAGAALCAPPAMTGLRAGVEAAVHARVEAALSEVGLEGASFRVEGVGPRGVRLARVRLDDAHAQLSIEHVDVEVNWLARRVDALTLRGAALSLEPHHASFLHGVVARAWAHAGGASAAPFAGPRVRLRQGQIVARRGAMRWTLAVEGELDPGRGRAQLSVSSAPLDLSLDAKLTLAEGGGLAGLIVRGRFGELPHALCVASATDARAVACSEQALRALRLDQLGLDALSLEARARGTTARDTTARDNPARGTNARDTTALDDPALDAPSRSGTLLDWELRARTESGLEARASGAFELGAARGGQAPDAHAREAGAPVRSLRWALEGPLPARALEAALGNVELAEDPRATLAGRAEARADGSWSLADVRGRVLVPSLRISTARARVETLRLEVAGHASLARTSSGEARVELTLEPSSRAEAARADLGALHAERLDLPLHLDARIDGRGLSLRSRGPMEARVTRLAIGEGPEALRFEPVALTLEDAYASKSGGGFEMRARADRVEGSLRGEAIVARGTLAVRIEGEQERITLPLTLRAGRLEQPASEASLRDARVGLPLRWEAGVFGAAGEVASNAMFWKGVLIGPTRGTVVLDDACARLAWSAPATSTASFALDAVVPFARGEGASHRDGDTRPRGRVDVEVPLSELRREDPLGRLVEALSGVRVEGPAAAHVHVDLAHEERSEARVELAGATLTPSGGSLRAEGVRGAMRFDRLDPLRGASAEPLLWSRLEAGPLVQLGEGSASLRWASGSREGDGTLEVSRFDASAAGGRAKLATFRVERRPEGEPSPEVELDLSLEGVELGQVMQALSGGRASATGVLDGRLELGVLLAAGSDGDVEAGLEAPPRVRLGRGRVQARGAGNVRMAGGPSATPLVRQLAAVLEGEWLSDRLVATMSDFDYRRLALSIDEVEGTKRLRAEFLGRGRSVPQDVDFTIQLRGVQPLLDQALRIGSWSAAPRAAGAEDSRAQRDVPQRDVPQRDVPQRDVPQRDVPQRGVPQRATAWSEAPTRAHGAAPGEPSR